MKFKRVFLIAMLVTTVYALGQQENLQSSRDLSGPVAQARCAYEKTRDCTPSANHDTRAQAQFPRRIPPRAAGPWGPGPRGYCCRSWPGPSNPSHAVIGALIGGTALAVALANVHPNGQSGPNLVGGLIGGVLGATFGAIIGNTVPSRRYYRHSWPDDDDNDEYASRNRSLVPHKTGLKASGKSEPVESATSIIPVHSAAMVP